MISCFSTFGNQRVELRTWTAVVICQTDDEIPGAVHDARLMANVLKHSGRLVQVVRVDPQLLVVDMLCRGFRLPGRSLFGGT